MIFATVSTPLSQPTPALVSNGRVYPLPFADMHEVIRVGASKAAQSASDKFFAAWMKSTFMRRSNPPPCETPMLSSSMSAPPAKTAAVMFRRNGINSLLTTKPIRIVSLGQETKSHIHTTLRPSILNWRSQSSSASLVLTSNPRMLPTAPLATRYSMTGLREMCNARIWMIFQDILMPLPNA